MQIQSIERLALIGLLVREVSDDYPRTGLGKPQAAGRAAIRDSYFTSGALAVPVRGREIRCRYLTFLAVETGHARVMTGLVAKSLTHWNTRLRIGSEI